MNYPRVAEPWSPKHHRRRATDGGSFGFGYANGHKSYTATCVCGAIFRGHTSNGQDRFRELHKLCYSDYCECCGREF